MTKSRNRLGAEKAWKPRSGESSQATTSGTSVEWTSIPSWVTRIELHFKEVSLSGTENLWIVLGDAGGYETTGYQGNAQRQVNSTLPDVFSNTVNFRILSNSASFEHIGTAVLEKVTDAGGDYWLCTYEGYGNTSTALSTVGRKALSADLDRVKVSSEGANTFDDGTITMYYS